MKRIALIACTCFLLAGSLTVALADTDRIQDANDTPGKLDVRFAVEGHKQTENDRLLRHRLTMFDRWSKRALARKGNFIHLFFDTDSDGGYERRLKITARKGELRARMQAWRGLDSVGRADVWRPNRRSVSVSFPASWLGDGLEEYKWIAITNYAVDGEGKCGLQGDVYKACGDRIPDKRKLTHQP